MYNLLMSVDPFAIDWSRAQFALTAIYHWLFVPLTLGLAVVMGIMETCYYRTKNVFWKDVAKFWQRLFGINFAMGVATGIILEFEFGTNWSNYSWFVGDIFGAPLAIEGIVAFFLESTFVAVMFFGWKKVSPGFHLASTWLTGFGATLSAWWILVANAWMQYPVGCEFNPDTVRNEMTSFADVALSPFAIDKFFHTVISSWIVGAVFVVAVSSWYLIKKRDQRLARESMKIGAVFGLVASLLAAFTGDLSAVKVAKVQPMKLAAMEALYDGGNGVRILAIDIDKPSADEAARNFSASPWPSMLESFHASLEEFRTMRQCTGFDHIFSNPPYYDMSLTAPDPRRNTARHTDSLSYRELVEFASAHLSPDGILSVILPADSLLWLTRYAGMYGLYRYRTVKIRTTARKQPSRAVVEFRMARPADIPPEELLTIHDGNGYSSEYIALTSDFYI